MLQPWPGKGEGKKKLTQTELSEKALGSEKGCGGPSEMDPVGASQLDLHCHVSCVDSKDPS